MPNEELDKKEEIVENSLPTVEETTTDVPTETAGDEAQEVIAEALGEDTEENTPPDPISTHFPNVTVTDENRAELETAVAEIEYASRSREHNMKLGAMIQANPMLAAVFNDMGKGADLMEALSRQVDLRSIVPEEGEADYDKWANADKERMSKFESDKARKATIEENRAKTNKVLEEFYADNEMVDDEEAKDSFCKYVDEVLNSAFDGDISRELLDRMYTAMTHLDELDAVAEEKFIDGKNAKIEDLKGKEDSIKTTDLPDLNGGGEAKTTSEKTTDPFLDDLQVLGRKKPILG